MVEVLEITDFYTQEAAYMDRVDPTWEEDNFQNGVAEESIALARVLGEADGRALLDCTCGRGKQTIALAQLGWQVSASDLTPASVAAAAQRAERAGCASAVQFAVCDARNLAQQYPPRFDRVISCMALDNLPDEAGIAQAIQEMYAVLRPGGMVYIRLRNIEQILEDHPRYEFNGERSVPFGRVIMVEDWEYPDDQHLVHIQVYLREDSRHPEYWDTNIFAYRRRILPKRRLAEMMEQAGFQQIQLIPGPNRWHPYEVIGTKPVAAGVELEKNRLA